MYDNSRHANWLLATLLFTLLLSSLILGGLLTRSSAFVSPHLLSATQLAENNLVSTKPATLNLATPIHLPELKTVKLASVEKPAIKTENKALPITAPTTSTITTLPLTLSDSQDYLDQAASTPQAILPLISLAANQPVALPKTTAPTAFNLHGLVGNSNNDNLHPPKSAWLYAGQFQNGKWSVLGLNLEPTALPEAHHAYQLTWGAKVRSAPPGQRMSTGSANLAESIGYLAEGSTIQVLTVKQSGKNGHIWLEIAYGE